MEGPGSSSSLNAALLPTPAASIANDGEEIKTWDARREIVRARAVNGNGMGEPLTIAAKRVAETQTGWGRHAPAIERWERELGRQAPEPTAIDGRNGKHRLSAQFVEWMMGIPEGWVTGVPLTRKEQLKALGNGVVPQQCSAALRDMLTTYQREA